MSGRLNRVSQPGSVREVAAGVLRDLQRHIHEREKIR
jgi:hypothetical protein